MGSEMCIRDREYAKQLELGRCGDLSDLVEEQRTAVGEGEPTVSTRGCTCLLYTSDAADERSSVDLGGRRIINKKKKKKLSLKTSKRHTLTITLLTNQHIDSNQSPDPSLRTTTQQRAISISLFV